MLGTWENMGREVYEKQEERKREAGSGKRDSYGGGNPGTGGIREAREEKAGTRENRGREVYGRREAEFKNWREPG